MFRIYRYVEDDELEPSQRPRGDNDNDELSDFEDESSDIDEMGDEDEEFSDDLETGEQEEDEDPDFQGVIRTVPGACLVYKRKDEQNTYEELWVYNVGGRDIKPEMRIRSSILAGTDIDPKTQKSPDGQQRCDTLSVGNVQFLHIMGLVN